MKDTFETKVGIVTRTVYRPIFLPRLVKSISSQTYKDFIWIIVDDEGGEKGQREKLYSSQMDKLTRAGITVKLIVNGTNKGRAETANIGIRSVHAQYAVLHDDDDSWEPSFLEKTVAFLDNNQDYVGVTTHMHRIDEKINGANVKKISSRVCNVRAKNVTIARMCQRNLFSPISFLFRKKAFDIIDGFNSALTVLEDYDFFLRLLLEGDIGVIQQPLANHHYRWDRHEDKKYDNTVTAGIDEHHKVYAEYINKKLRDDISDQRISLGFVLAMGEMFSDTTNLFERLYPIKHSWKKINDTMKKMLFIK